MTYWFGGSSFSSVFCLAFRLYLMISVSQTDMMSVSMLFVIVYDLMIIFFFDKRTHIYALLYILVEHEASYRVCAYKWNTTWYICMLSVNSRNENKSPEDITYVLNSYLLLYLTKITSHSMVIFNVIGQSDMITLWFLMMLLTVSKCLVRKTNNLET